MKDFNYALIVCDQMDCYMFAIGYANLNQCINAREKFDNKGYKTAIYKGETFRNYYLYDHALSSTDVFNLITSVYEGEVLDLHG